MTNFTGLFAAGILHNQQPIVSSSLARFGHWVNGFRGGIVYPANSGARSVLSVIPFFSWNNSATECSFTNHLDKILVTDVEHDAGYVFDPKTWNVYIWSTFYRKAFEIASNSVSGEMPPTVTGSTPSILWPGGSRTYVVDLPVLGPATIENRITWVITGSYSVYQDIYGTRLTVFAFRPDWSTTPVETLSFKTEVLSSFTGHEQRVSLRSKPRYTLAYRVQTTTENENQRLENLLYNYQGKLFGIPWWMERTELTSAINPGDLSIAINTLLSPSFEVDGFAIVLTGISQFEVFTISKVYSDYIEVYTKAKNPWPIGTAVYPLRRGRLGTEQQLTRPVNWINVANFEFTCEAI